MGGMSTDCGLEPGCSLVLSTHCFWVVLERCGVLIGFGSMAHCWALKQQARCSGHWLLVGGRGVGSGLFWLPRMA